jgi:hypothetical protein
MGESSASPPKKEVPEENVEYKSNDKAKNHADLNILM